MAFNPECNSFTSALTNTITSNPAQQGQIILYQSPIGQLPSITYAQLPSAHYVLLRSQTNPNEFQIVSEFPPSTSTVCPIWAAPYPFIGTVPMYALPPSNQQQRQIFPGSYQMPIMNYNSFPEVQQNHQIASHPMQLGAGTVIPNNDQEISDETDQFFEVQRGSAFHNTLLYSDFRPRSHHNDLMRFMTQLSHQLKFKILNLLNRFGGLKIWSSIEVEYSKPNENIEPIPGFLNTKAQTVFNDFELDHIVSNIIAQTLERNANFIQIRSGLVIQKVKCATIHVSSNGGAVSGPKCTLA